MEYTINHKKLSECNLNELDIYNKDIPFDIVLDYMKKYFNLKYTNKSKINYNIIKNDYILMIKSLDFYICSDIPIYRLGKYYDKKIITRNFIISKILDTN